MSNTASWLQPFKGSHEILLGRSFRRFIKNHSQDDGAAKPSLPVLNTRDSRDNDYIGIRYRFEPKSVDPTKPSTLERRAAPDTYSMRRPTESGDHVQFEGQQRPARTFDMLLLYDEHSRIVTLEKLDSQFDFAHTGFTSGSSVQQLVAPVTKPSPATVSSQPTPEDRALQAEIEAALTFDDADADGEADEDFELEEVPVLVSPQVPPATSYASYADEEDFSLPAPPPAPGKGKGVARANEVVANAKKGKPKAKAAAPRGKKRGRAQDDDDEFEPVAIPVVSPKRRKSSPVPAPAPVFAAPAPPRPQELLVPPPIPIHTEDYTSSEDEMVEEIIPDVNGYNAQPVDEEVADEYDAFESALDAVIPEGDGDIDDDAEMEGEIFGGIEDEGEVNDNATEYDAAQSNEYTNGNGAAFSTLVDTSSDDSDDDDDDDDD